MNSEPIPNNVSDDTASAMAHTATVARGRTMQRSSTRRYQRLNRPSSGPSSSRTPLCISKAHITGSNVSENRSVPSRAYTTVSAIGTNSRADGPLST